MPLFWNKKYIDSFEQKSVLLASNITAKSIIEFSNEQSSNNDLEIYKFFLGGQISNYQFNSSAVSSFGGVYTDERNKLDIFLTNSFDFLSKNYGIRSFKLRLPPEHLIEFNQKIQIQSLLNLDFSISLIEINYAIDVKNWSIDLMSRGNRKKLKQCTDNNLSFRQLEFESLSSIYDLLKTNRRNIGASLSVDLLKLSNLISLFPTNYFLFGVFYQDILVAASICVETFPTNLYVFYWGDDINFRYFSPVTFLAKEIIDFAKLNEYKYLDLGTVGPDGVYINSLAKYKQNLGATYSFKLSLEKTFL